MMGQSNSSSSISMSSSSPSESERAHAALVERILPIPSEVKSALEKAIREKQSIPANYRWYDSLPPNQMWQDYLQKIIRVEEVVPNGTKQEGAPSNDAVAAASSAATSSSSSTPAAAVAESGYFLPKPAAKPSGHLRFIAVSDTHNRHDRLQITNEWLHANQIDVLVHTGDFTNLGLEHEVTAFVTWLESLTVPYKVVIAGNHDLSLDCENYAKSLAQRFRHKFVLDSFQLRQRIHTNASVPLAQPAGLRSAAEVEAISRTPFPSVAAVPAGKSGGTCYLEDSGVQINGINIYGSPFSPWFHDWGFNAERGADIRKLWAMIPSQTDVLLTHGPPVGFGDAVDPPKNKEQVGCVDLALECCVRLKPQVVIGGHIHEGWGERIGVFPVVREGVETISEHRVRVINASNLYDYHDHSIVKLPSGETGKVPKTRTMNPPIIFDVPIPKNSQ